MKTITLSIVFPPLLLLLLLVVSDVRTQQYPTTGNRQQTISNIFDIPIQTLTAISKFLQGTRPLGEVIREQQAQRPVAVAQRPYTGQRPYSGQRPSTGQRPFALSAQYYYSPNRGGQRSRAARIAGVYTAADGSAFKI